jgi:D-sedoheptulose 7-phosphate isomerase
MFDIYLANFQALLNRIECTAGNKCIDVNNAIDQVVSQIDKLRQDGQKLMWIGNGGSAAIAEHSALDYFRTGNIKAQAFNDGPLITCIGNDFGYPAVFEKPIALYAENNDLLMAISSSGRSANILNAVTAARKKGCRVITFSGFLADNPLRSMGDLNFYVPANHYGHVELAHSVLCHSFLDLFMMKQNEGN